MNAKTCKKLRFTARAATVGMPERAYTINHKGSIELSPRCTCAAYKQLKKLCKLQ